jgi:hypothetical protein
MKTKPSESINRKGGIAYRIREECCSVEKTFDQEFVQIYIDYST